MKLTIAYHIAEEVAKELPGAVIYGGFWRDMLLNRPVSDIDVALPTKFLKLEEMGFVQQSHDDSDYDHDHIHATWRRGNINICEITSYVSPKRQNKYVDIGLCAVAWSQYEGLIIDNDFLTDWKNQTLTVRRRGWGEEGVINHMARLKLKYPEFTEVWP
jgi:hypothetical protein